jgi:plasmid stabilization system protein ParE
MKIIFEPIFVDRLLTILTYISKDKKSASSKFKKELKEKISNLKENPYIYRASYYFESENYRDLIHQGYTIIYKVEEDTIMILEIFKWQDR